MPLRRNAIPVSSLKSGSRPLLTLVATDNPLVNGENGHVYHGGNFQAMSVTNAMEKTRLALHHLGRIIFAQVSELVNPAMNRGLPPSLAATDPSVNYHAKGLDIAYSVCRAPQPICQVSLFETLAECSSR